MKKIFLLAWMAFSALSAAYAQQRVVQNMNDGWRFHTGTIADTAEVSDME